LLAALLQALASAQQLAGYVHGLCGAWASLHGELKSLMNVHQQAAHEARTELRAGLGAVKAARAAATGVDAEVAALEADARAEPAPCIIFLDSLKMHRLQNVARQLRIYLEHEVRQRYMSAQERREARDAKAEGGTAAGSAPMLSAAGSADLAAAAGAAEAEAAGAAATCCTGSADTPSAAEPAPTPTASGTAGIPAFLAYRLEQAIASVAGTGVLDGTRNAVPGGLRQVSSSTDATGDAGAASASDAAGDTPMADATGDTAAPPRAAPPAVPELRAGELPITTAGGAASPPPKRLSQLAAWRWLANVSGLVSPVNLPAKQPLNLPRQTNDCDCGVFLMRYVESFCRPAPPHITAAHLGNALRDVFGKEWFPQDAIARMRMDVRQLLLADVGRREECREKGALLPPRSAAEGVGGGGSGANSSGGAAAGGSVAQGGTGTK
jgi:hypothetical protein